MKKLLLISGAVALSLVGVMFVTQADDRVYADREGREYTREHRGIVGGTMSGLFGGGHRERNYLDDEDSRDGINQRNGDNRGYRGDRRGDRR